MIKKILALLLATMLVICMVACSESVEGPKNDSDTIVTTEPDAATNTDDITHENTNHDETQPVETTKPNDNVETSTNPAEKSDLSNKYFVLQLNHFGLMSEDDFSSLFDEALDSDNVDQINAAIANARILFVKVPMNSDWAYSYYTDYCTASSEDDEVIIELFRYEDDDIDDTIELLGVSDVELDGTPYLGLDDEWHCFEQLESGATIHLYSENKEAMLKLMNTFEIDELLLDPNAESDLADFVVGEFETDGSFSVNMLFADKDDYSIDATSYSVSLSGKNSEYIQIDTSGASEVFKAMNAAMEECDIKDICSIESDYMHGICVQNDGYVKFYGVDKNTASGVVVSAVDATFDDMAKIVGALDLSFCEVEK